MRFTQMTSSVLCVLAALLLTACPQWSLMLSTVRAEPAAATAGELTVLSHPLGAEVVIDGVLRGTTPLVVSDLAPGTHVVKIRLEGYPVFEETIELRSGVGFDLEVDLSQKEKRVKEASLRGPSKGSFYETLYVIAGAVIVALLVLWYLDRSGSEEEAPDGGGKGPP